MPPTSPLPPQAGGSSSAEPGCDGFLTARDAKNRRRFYVWLFATMLAYLSATAALRWRESFPGALGRLFPWVLVGLALVLGVQATRSYMVFLRRVDELLRKIETEALALGFAAGAAVSLFYPLLESLGAPKLDGEATAVIMMLAAGVGHWLGLRRYCGSGPA